MNANRVEVRSWMDGCGGTGVRAGSFRAGSWRAGDASEAENGGSHANEHSGARGGQGQVHRSGEGRKRKGDRREALGLDRAAAGHCWRGRRRQRDISRGGACDCGRGDRGQAWIRVGGRGDASAGGGGSGAFEAGAGGGRFHGVDSDGALGEWRSADGCEDSVELKGAGDRESGRVRIGEGCGAGQSDGGSNGRTGERRGFRAGGGGYAAANFARTCNDHREDWRCGAFHGDASRRERRGDGEETADQLERERAAGDDLSGWSVRRGYARHLRSGCGDWQAHGDRFHHSCAAQRAALVGGGGAHTHEKCRRHRSADDRRVGRRQQSLRRDDGRPAVCVRRFRPGASQGAGQFEGGRAALQRCEHHGGRKSGSVHARRRFEPQEWDCVF